MVIFRPMKNRFRNILAFSIFPQIGFILWLRGAPEIVETYYSQGIYPFIASIFRHLYGWIPFSLGDCLYAFLLVTALVYLVRKRRRILEQPLEFLRNAMIVLSVAYFSFHLLWGFNYYRQPLSKMLQLRETYTTNELIALTEQLIARTNALQNDITLNPDQPVIFPYGKEEIMERTLHGYNALKGLFPFLEYHNPSIKKSLYSTLLTYMGYGGYLNPFTNEAQVNRKIPNLTFPVVCGHEIGHQLGYSAENETNFIGYLVTASNEDPYFQYAGYSYAASYCLSEINRKDPELFKSLYGQFNPGVRKNYEAVDAFWKQYENLMEPVFKSVFNNFLKANNQAEGIQSYNRIVSLLVTYHRTHPV